MNNILKNSILTFLCCFGFFNPVLAQTGNPFEILGRKNLQLPVQPSVELDSSNLSSANAAFISPTDLVDEHIAVEENQVTTTNDPNNPFEIIRGSNINVSPTKDSVQKKKTVLKKENKPTGTSTNNLLFWLMTSVLIGLAFFITIFRSYLTKVYRSFFNHNILRLSHREQRAGIDFPYLFLYALFFINMCIFIFLGLTKFYPNQFVSNSSTLLQIGGLVTGAYLTKHLVLNFLDYVFQIKPEMGLYNFTIMIFNNLLGILLVPFNFAIAFASPELAKTLIIIGLLAIGAVSLFRAARSFLLAMKLFSFHKFHFFIYLCAVEIAPVIVLIKYMMIQNGIQ